MRKILFLLGLIAALTAPVAGYAQNRSSFAGTFNAVDFAYGVAPNVAPLLVLSGSTGTGSYTVTVAYGNTTTPSGQVFAPLSTTAPVTIGGGTNMEVVTPSAVSCSTPAQYGTCSFTASFTYSHGDGDQVRTGTVGLQEAINYTNSYGGGIVATSQGWYSLGGLKATITAVTSATPKVWIYDTSGVGPVWYGKSGTTSAAYSAVNNDMTFQLTLATSGSTATKTLSQTYAVKPSCVASVISGTFTGPALTVAPTTTTVVVTDATASETPVIQVNCVLQK